MALLDQPDRREASPLLADLHYALGKLLFTAGHYGEAGTASERAAHLARACGNRRTQVLAEWNQVHVLIKLSRMEEGLQLAQSVLALAEEVDDLHILASVHADLAVNHSARGTFALARGHIDRAAAAAEQSGDRDRLTAFRAIRGWIDFLAGDWRMARMQLERAAAVSDQGDTSWYATYPLLFLGRLRLGEGNWRAAVTAADRARALAEQSSDLQGLRWSSAVLAELEIAEGRADAAFARLVPLLDRPGLEEGDVTDLLPVVAWAHLEVGRLDEAAEIAARASIRARADNVRPVLVEVLRVQALIALRQGAWQVAEQSLDEGLGLTRGMPYPYAEARLLFLRGGLHRTQGATEPARQCLQDALAIFRRLGARRDVEHTEAVLRDHTPIRPTS
jgi:tetratricopeptide (TPR) repeat protein